MKHEKLWVVSAGLGFGLVIAACAGSQPNVTPAKTVPAEALAPAEVAAPAPEPAASPIVASPSEAGSTTAVNSNPSCDGRVGAGNDCGSGESCCARGLVPEGDVTYRRLDAGPGEKRHLRAFALDKFEATVGRFRAWVAAGQPAPKEGDVLYDDGEGHALKWPKNGKIQDAVHLEGWKRYDTWTGGDDKRPKNNITWFTATAFCKWDGGRLPTDVEWTRASRGGEEDRAYPWGTEHPSAEHAVYNCLGDGNKDCALVDILAVGSKPKGVGRWGQYDLAGSMFEWTSFPGRVAGADTVERARGGGFCYIGGVDRRASTDLRPAVFREEAPETLSHMTGVRCAYDVPSNAAPNATPGGGGGSEHAK